MQTGGATEAPLTDLFDWSVFGRAIVLALHHELRRLATNRFGRKHGTARATLGELGGLLLRQRSLDDRRRGRGLSPAARSLPLVVVVLLALLTRALPVPAHVGHKVEAPSFFSTRQTCLRRGRRVRRRRIKDEHVLRTFFF